MLELGCGAGRITGYLGARGGEVLGIDISPDMVDYCRRRYPELEFQVGDLSDLSGLAGRIPGPRRGGVQRARSARRRRSPARPRRDSSRARRQGRAPLLRPQPGVRPEHPEAVGARHPVAESRPGDLESGAPAAAHEKSPADGARLERRESDYALVNDQAHDFRFLHYYIGRDAQDRQLEEAGFELLECLDGDGSAGAVGRDGVRSAGAALRGSRSAEGTLKRGPDGGRPLEHS